MAAPVTGEGMASTAPVYGAPASGGTAEQPPGYVMQAQPVQYAPAGTNGAAPVGIANAGYVMAPATSPSGGNAVMMQPMAQQMVVNMPAQGGEGQTGGAPQVVYVMAQPQQQQVAQPVTFDDHVKKNMETNRVCGVEGLNLDVAITCGSVHQIGCGSVFLYWLLAILCIFGCPGAFAALFTTCCISVWSSILASIGSLLSLCCKCGGKTHRTGWVSLFMFFSLMMILVAFIYFTIFPVFELVWLVMVMTILYGAEIYFGYEWLQIVTKTQVEMGESANYCEFC